MTLVATAAIGIACIAHEREQKSVVWVEMDGVTVPLPPKEHPRVFVRSEEIPALKVKMEHPDGKIILKQLKKAAVPRTPEEEAAEKDTSSSFKRASAISQILLHCIAIC